MGTTILLQTETGRNRMRNNPLKRRLEKKLHETQNGIQNPQNQILIMARKRKNPLPDGRRLKESPLKRNRLRKRKKRVVTTILKIRTLKLQLEKTHKKKIVAEAEASKVDRETRGVVLNTTFADNDWHGGKEYSDDDSF